MIKLYVCSLFLFTALQFLCLYCFNLNVNHTIIYEDPSKGSGKRGSYFGFSLFLYSGNNRTQSWIQIGAPRGNDSIMYKGVKEPGVVYRCPILDTCKTVALDSIRSGTTFQEYLEGTLQHFADQKDGAWIGGAMDIDEMNGRTVVCGHRWGYENRKHQFVYMLGVCYWTNVEQSITDTSGVFKLIPLNKPDNYFHPSGNNPYYLLNYGVGQAGISVHFPKIKGKPQLLLGAPGLSNWKGSAVFYEANDNNRYSSYTFSKVLDPRSLDIKQYSLFGYQVNSGKFGQREFYYVTGNPKGDNKGKVFLYTIRNKRDVKVEKRLDGYQIGEYFGSSLAVADINCDGVDDLIVGSPLYTVNHDEGRIYIFISNSQTTVFNSPIPITGKILGGRFGTSVTSLGDLDKDGCGDIAVGAPYANNNTGVVYIYYGDPRGPFLSQEISANEIHSELKGFGITISRGTDVDQNGYLDVAVGAYMSGQAVLFRAEPVVYLNTKVTANVVELQKDKKTFIITVCLSYTGPPGHTPKSLNVSRTIDVDDKLRRAFFASKEITSTAYVHIKNNKHCEDIEIFLLKTAVEENTSDPISVKVNQEIVNSEGKKTTVVIGSKSNIKSNDGFKKDFPIVSERHSKKMAVLNVPFATECGGQSECEAELELNCRFSGITNGVYIIGSKSRLNLEVNLTNTKQPAYRTVVNISIPSPIHLSSGHKNCRESSSKNGLLLFCNFGNPLRNGTLKNLTLNLETSEVGLGTKNLTFYISASTSSKDKNEEHNSQQLQLHFIIDADIGITGRSEENIYNYANSNRTVFKHRYEVQKKGASPIEVAEIELSIPVRLTGPRNKTFLDLYRPLVYLNAEQEVTCLTKSSYEYHEDENTQNVESLDMNFLRVKREGNELQFQTNDTLFLTCAMPDVECIKIICNAGPFGSESQDSASVELKMIMNISNLREELGENRTIYLSTQGSVSIKEPNITQTSQRFHNAVINTTFVNNTYTEPLAQGVPTWIIALSMIAGIFILMLVVFGFMKAGFFERKKKEELESLMAVYATNVFTVGMASKTQEKDKEEDDDDDDDDDDDESACDSRDELQEGDSEEL